MTAPRILYLHGFGSGPRSAKGMAFADHLAARGLVVDRLDLRVPSFEHLRLSAMLEVVRTAIPPTDRAIVIGSSLGGLTAARVAEGDPRIFALVLLAPAFQLATRWQQLPGWSEWERTGWRQMHDHTTGGTAQVDFGFVQDLGAIDVGFPDVRVPTLILHGTADDAVPIEFSRRFAEGRPNVQLIELADDHQLIASIPRLLAETDRFLARVLDPVAG
ncbi:MAG: YqiA/YcfP family alpha/beta fold hydrolase [Kofleriaceae bacterium]